MNATRARLLALRVALVLAFVPWLVQPGVIQPDTKVDLVVSPWRYLARSLDAWSTHSGFGELQNQAYGYLFPMGPFFGVLHSLGVPGWAAQRAWWSFILVVGFLGAALVARRIAGLSAGAACVTGVAYALSARVLTLLSELSVETWPGMLLPWLVLAVWWGWRSGRHIRLLASTGVLVACLGGVNATASLVAVLGAGLFALVVTREWRLVGAYVIGAALGSAWWLGPLVVLGGYAYPFLDFIETARITTAVTTLPAILRGASDWVAYIVDADGHPVWQSGWVVAQGTLSIVAGSTLAGIALAGLMTTRGGASRGAQDDVIRAARRVRVACVILLAGGIVGMALPYAGTHSGPFSGLMRDLLDGPLAAARNVHKLDPLVRLPLAIGVGAAWDALARRKTRADHPRAARTAWVARAGILVVLVGTLAPLLVGRLGDANGVRAWPASLVATARDVDDAAARDGGSSLVLPSTRSAQADWGNATDEPLTAFAASSIVVRASAPLYHPGAQRLVDAVDTALAPGSASDRGRASEAVQAAARAGVHRIVVRWGSSTSQQTSPPQAYVAALTHADGVSAHRVHGSGATRYDVFDLAPTPSTTGAAVSVLGGPESTLTLAGVGVSARRPFVTGRADGWITDDVRRRAYNNGQVVGRAFGPALTADDPAPTRVGAHDLDFPGRDAGSSVRRVTGASRIEATSSTADPFASLYLGPGTSADAAFDGSDDTRWLTCADRPSTLSVTWDGGAPAQTMTLVPAATGDARVASVDVRFDGRSVKPQQGAGSTWRIDVPAGTRAVAVTPRAAPGTGTKNAAVGLVEVRSTRPVVSVVHLPGTVDGTRNGVVVTRTHPWFDGHALASEDDGAWTRAFTVSRAATMNVTLTFKAGVAPGSVREPLMMRSGSGAWQPAGTPGGGADTAGRTRLMALPAGEANLKVSPEVERVTLVPAAAAARDQLGLSADSSTDTPANPTLASTQGANAGWALDPASPTPASGMTAGSTRLVTLDGWRQGAEHAAHGQHFVFAPQHLHRLSLVVGAACALACLVLLIATTWCAAASSRRAAPIRRQAASDDFALQTPRALVAHAESAVPASRPRAALALAVLTAIAAALLGWVAIPVVLVACFVPRRRRRVLVIALMVAVGPIMAALGVVDRGSLGAVSGQVLTALALVVFSLEVSSVPSGWRVLRRRAN